MFGSPIYEPLKFPDSTYSKEAKHILMSTQANSASIQWAAQEEHK